MVMEENRGYRDILRTAPASPSRDAPYIRWLAQHGASMTNMYAEFEESQPNYLALFSRSAGGANSDDPPTCLLTRPSVGGELIGAGLSFASYSEDLPSAGSLEDSSE